MDKLIDLTNLKILKNKVEVDLYLNNPIVNKCLQLFADQQISYEQALLGAIIYLAEDNKRLQEIIINKQRKPSKNI